MSLLKILSGFEGLAQMLTDYAERVTLVINLLIYVEISIGFHQVEELEAALPADFFRCGLLPYETAFLAGQRFLQYRRRAGVSLSPLSDFYLGAHAVIAEMPLLTRDVNRYRAYFPTVHLLTP
ncbi:PilT domain-containing protein (plasmid) [Crinalium epipsammum PCC 9333]|uniref:PilT domain-containing protein n=1 Tax=Crinalium epipsammum PCC 9333 TaxID=1173022 RepID=K9W764_9CYAN|nr:PilT domain-containing protein [Crinalium epipsammum]AFZ15592.1 PilT domain-containing protein [Crinalium epipsammum PCC 9333]